jgi:putative hemolysin
MDADGIPLVRIAAGLNFHLPQFDGVAWLQLTILVIALVLCAVASAAETALTSVSRIKLKNLVEEGDEQAAELERLLARPNTFLSTILVVNSIAVIVASSMATVLALRFSESWGELIATVLISLIVLIFCEITPKTAAVQNPLRWARALSGFVRAAAWFLGPLVWLLGMITTALASVLGGEIKHPGPFVTEEELRLLVSVGEQEGVLEEEETEMIHSIFEFADTPVREVMVPRIDMITLEADTAVDEAVDVALQVGLSRIPVYEQTLDNILGILYTKDLLKQLREGQQKRLVRELVRPAYFVPETKKLDDLLREIRQRRTHMAIVVDEYGSVAGLVTIEDLMEEIVGDIKDEYDREENLYERVSEHEYIVDAKMNIDDFNDLMETRLDNEDYETLGGFLYAQLDKIPVAGDTITYGDLNLTVLATRGRRITKVRVVRLVGEKAIEGEQSSERSGQLLLPATESRRGSEKPPSPVQHSLREATNP